jgi:glycosyltransferase involved in cell wall biosynthesis
MSRSRREAPKDLAALMLVSANVDASLRAGVNAGSRPCPEFLRLETRYGVKLLDWSALRWAGSHRSALGSVAHVAGALRQVRRADVVFSDGEHVGIPLAVAMTVLRIKTPHLVIGHHLSTPSKEVMFRWLKAYGRMDRIIVHSPNQLDLAANELGFLATRLRVVPYGIDTDFWSPQPVPEQEGLVVSAGREHRDYTTLLQACPRTAKLFIADHSPHSPKARRREPDMWPENVERRGLGPMELRRMYAQSTVVVVPVIDTPFPFGITTLLEAMSMAKAIVVADTDGLRGIVEHDKTGVVVPSGDVRQLRVAIEDLLTDTAKRRRLGEQARQAATERFALDAYVHELARHLHELAGRAPDQQAGR